MSAVRIRFAAVFYFFAVAAFLILFPLALNAQIGTDASLTLNPSNPLPNSEVTVSLNAYSVDTTGATISWFIDGVEQQQSRNLRSITVDTGDIGTSKTIRTTVTPQGGFGMTLTRTITPASVDIIVEADTYVPSFYKGRALPTSGAPIRIIAIPHTRSGEAAGTYTYKWELGNKVLFGGPLKGRNVVETTMPQYNDETLIVTVFDGSSNVVAKGVRSLSIADPEILFYEDNPLRGTSRRAVTDTYTLIGDEVTVKAEPYFMNTVAALDGTILYEWSVNNRRIGNPSDDPRAITLRKSGGAGSALVDLMARNTKDLLQFTRGNFSIFFE